MKTSTLFHLIFAGLLLLVKTATAQPAFPTNVVALPATNGIVGVRWDAAAPRSTNANDAIKGYWVYLGISPRVYNVKEFTTNLTHFFSNQSAGFTYYITVRSVSAANIESDAPPEIAIPLQKPSAPTGISTARLEGVIEAAPFPDGPWTQVAQFRQPVFLVADARQKFFRIKAGIEHGPRLKP